MRMKNTPCNPLADVIYDELTPILEAIYEATTSIELEACRSGGVQIDGENRYRTSTDSECFQVEVSLFMPKANFDARWPLFAQLSEWLKQCADSIDEARDAIERIEGVRDMAVIPRKKAGVA